MIFAGWKFLSFIAPPIWVYSHIAIALQHTTCCSQQRFVKCRAFIAATAVQASVGLVAFLKTYVSKAHRIWEVIIEFKSEEDSQTTSCFGRDFKQSGTKFYSPGLHEVNLLHVVRGILGLNRIGLHEVNLLHVVQAYLGLYEVTNNL